MYIKHLRLRNFRNYVRVDVEFGPGLHFLIGKNGQGKTNLLEAIYLLSTLRSFRGCQTSQLIYHGASAFLVGAEIIGVTKYVVKYYWSKNIRKLTLNGEQLHHNIDYFGVFKAVIFSPEDIALIKGPPAIRRRFMDLLLSQIDKQYFINRQSYLETLRARNSLLKASTIDLKQLEAFSQQLITYGTYLIKARTILVQELNQIFQEIYRLIAGNEQVELVYKPSVDENFELALSRSLENDIAYKQTHLGPHRDELLILLNQRSAQNFASEGQKRTISIALRISQAIYVTQKYGQPPVLLLDDILGELDSDRQFGLVTVIERIQKSSGQIFITITDEPLWKQWPSPITKWEVVNGSIKPV